MRLGDDGGEGRTEKEVPMRVYEGCALPRTLCDDVSWGAAVPI